MSPRRWESKMSHVLVLITRFIFFFHWDFNSRNILKFKILKGEQVSGEPGVVRKK